MSRYKVWVCLEAEYDDIEADTPEEAFIQASDGAMAGGDWDFRIRKLNDYGEWEEIENER